MGEEGEGGEGGGAAEEEEDTTVYTYIPPTAKEWVSQGAEIEIDEESLQENRKRVSTHRKWLSTPEVTEYTGSAVNWIRELRGWNGKHSAQL